jgi:1-acyl-sn-glycerol-3-phosphate acyltransferase
MISRLFTQLCVLWFKWRGWTIEGGFPPEMKQYVLVVAPHTSNVDFFVGVAARKLLGINVKYLAKSELFRFPVRRLLLNLGGYPVDRSKKNALVDQVTDFFHEQEDFALCVTPEGTRGKVGQWRTGFYIMAVKAEVPIVMVGFDYKYKKVVVSPPFKPSGDMEKDIRFMHGFFEKINSKHPEKSMYGEK